MTLLATAIPNLISGVSQQPPTLRLETSCKEMINGWPSVVSGLNKRPPTEHIANITGVTIPNNVAGYLIDREDSYRYIVVASGLDLKVFDLNGTEQTVTFPNGKAYLTQALDPVKDFRFLTIGDTTFILNRRVTVKADDFGESGTVSYSPTATVANVSDLPAPGSSTLGWVYYVTNTKEYYRFEVGATTAAQYAWGFTSSQTGSGYFLVPQYDGLPQPPSSAGVVIQVKSTSSSQVYTFDADQRAGYYTTVYTDTYSKYTSYLSQAGVTAPSSWVKRPLAALTTVSNARLDPTNRGTVHVTASIANVYYTVYVNGVLKAQYLTPKGVDAASSVPGTDQIANELYLQLVAAGFTCSRIGSTIGISNITTGYSLIASATNGDKAVKAYTSTVNQFTDLPPNEINGRIVKVRGDVKDGGDDYYVRFDSSTNTWVETVGYNQGGSFQDHTMPHALVRNSDGTWTFKLWAWDNREAGDIESNPDPSFMDQTVNDIFLYGGRLCFLSDENIIMSESNSYENFYRTSLATLLDSDVIDLAVLNNGVDKLWHGAPFNDDLLMLSDKSQFRLSYTQFLGPKNIQIKFTTNFQCSPKVKPVNMGGAIYFIDDKTEYAYAKMWEYFPKDNRVGDDAEDSTAPVPEYIPSGVKFLTGSSRIKTMVMGSSLDPSALYVYKFYWAADRKIQNAWHKWQFETSDTIYWAGFSGNYIYILINRSSGLTLERMRLDEGVALADVRTRTLVDRQVSKSSLTMSYNSGTDLTTITLPYSTTANVEVISSLASVDPEIAESDTRHDVNKLSTTQVTVAGDITGHTTVICGIPYTFRFVFSTLYFRQAKGQGQVVVLDGTRLQLRYLSLEYHDTAYFTTKLTLPGRTDIVSTFDGKILGNPEVKVGRTPFLSGVFRVPLVGNNQDVELAIENDAPFNCTFGSAEFNFLFAPRAKKRV